MKERKGIHLPKKRREREKKSLCGSDESLRKKVQTIEPLVNGALVCRRGVKIGMSRSFYAR